MKFYHYLTTSKLVLPALFLLITLPLFPSAALPRTFYVSPDGNDNNSGLAPDQAWQTIDRVNRTDFKPGDTILFTAPGYYPGSLLLTEEDCLGGTAGAPTTIGSYGDDWAAIVAGLAPGIRVDNCDHVDISNLFILGQDGNRYSGVEILNNLAGDRMLAGISVDRMYISGFRFGVRVRAADELSGIRDISITNITAARNEHSGISLLADVTDPTNHDYPFANVHVSHNHVYQTSGDPAVAAHNTGSGIIVANARDVVIEHNSAHDNGVLNDSHISGPIGIWAYDCLNTVIQNNLSYSNRTNSTVDGGGFDLDGGCQDSVIQYNVSYDNDGAGYMVGQYWGARPMRNITVRYNLSIDDCRRNRCGALHLFKESNTEMEDVFFYNNTVYVSPEPGSYPSAFGAQHNYTEGAVNVIVANNLFITSGGARLIDVYPAGTNEIYFRGNNYDSSGQAFKILYLDKTYNSLAAWRKATGQERYQDSGIATGLDQPSGVVNPGGLEPADYRLLAGSPLINTGLDLEAHFSLPPGTADFFDNPIPAYGAYDIGMHEFPEPAATSTPAATLTPVTPATATPEPPADRIFLPATIR